MWSLRHRRFEAWQCTDPARCHIVHATSAAELWGLMEQAEADPRRTSPAAYTQCGQPSGFATPGGPRARSPPSRSATGPPRTNSGAMSLVVGKEPIVIPPYDTPEGDRLNVTKWHPGAIAALKHLRTELHAHRIYPTISYDRGQPRLVISAELSVWADRAGTVFCWGTCFLEEPADQAPTEDLPQVARRLAGRLGKHYAEPVDSP